MNLILTNIFNRIQFRDGKKYSTSFLITQKNFFLYEEFKQRLSIEKRRAEKMDTPLSIISSKLEFDKKTNRYSVCGVDGNLLIEIILSTVRETDVVSLRDFKEILVLLPDTKTSKAQLVVNGFVEKIKKIQYSQINEENKIFHNFKIINVRNLTQESRISSQSVGQASTLS